MDLKGHKAAVYCCAFSKDSLRLISLLQCGCGLRSCYDIHVVPGLLQYLKMAVGSSGTRMVSTGFCLWASKLGDLVLDCSSVQAEARSSSSVECRV